MGKQSAIENGYYGKLITDQEGNVTAFVPFGRMLSIDAILYSVETKVISYRLRFENDAGDVVFHEITRSDLLAKQIPDADLVDKGAKITQNSLSCFRECFMQLLWEGNHPIILSYHHVGFQKLQINTTLENTEQEDSLPPDAAAATPSVQNSTEIVLFKGQNIVLADDITNPVAVYTGNLDLNKHGEFQAWCEGIQADILPHTKTLVAFLGGACAIPTGLIGSVRHYTNPIFHFYGDSGTGKSCIGKIIASIYGRPFDEPVEIDGLLYNSVYGSWTGTENAIRDNCVGNHGMTIILNELGKSRIKDMGGLLYDFSEGTTKKRSSATGDVRQRQGYRTSFVSIGEFSIFHKCTEVYEGLLNRVMELDAPFTVDAAHAKRLEKLGYDHCGHAAEIMAAYILNNGGQSLLVEIYDRHYCSFEEKLQNPSPTANRFLSTFAAPILMTAELANLSWNLNIDVNEIEEFLLDYLKTKETEADLVKVRFDLIIELCMRNKAMFLHKGSPVNMQEHHMRDLWGTMETFINDNGSTEYKIWLYPSMLESLCKENGMPSAKSCMKQWKKRGWVDAEKDRETKRDSKKQPYYVLIVSEIKPIGKVYKKLDENKIRENSILFDTDADTEEKSVRNT